ncbi:MAG: hypothetical protein HAW59_07285, partial [Betaproteobacteria bacterium]|nr:hypothetical protein [Betaproteobacteria bacterium]
YSLATNAPAQIGIDSTSGVLELASAFNAPGSFEFDILAESAGGIATAQFSLSVTFAPEITPEAVRVPVGETAAAATLSVVNSIYDDYRFAFEFVPENGLPREVFDNLRVDAESGVVSAGAVFSENFAGRIRAVAVSAGGGGRLFRDIFLEIGSVAPLRVIPSYAEILENSRETVGRILAATAADGGGAYAYALNGAPAGIVISQSGEIINTAPLRYPRKTVMTVVAENIIGARLETTFTLQVRPEAETKGGVVWRVESVLGDVRRGISGGGGNEIMLGQGDYLPNEYPLLISPRGNGFRRLSLSYRGPGGIAGVVGAEGDFILRIAGSTDAEGKVPLAISGIRGVPRIEIKGRGIAATTEDNTRFIFSEDAHMVFLRRDGIALFYGGRVDIAVSEVAGRTLEYSCRNTDVDVHAALGAVSRDVRYVHNYCSSGIGFAPAAAEYRAQFNGDRSDDYVFTIALSVTNGVEYRAEWAGYSGTRNFAPYNYHMTCMHGGGRCNGGVEFGG